jgi:hypothetical protein
VQLRFNAFELSLELGPDSGSCSERGTGNDGGSSDGRVLRHGRNRGSTGWLKQRSDLRIDVRSGHVADLSGPEHYAGNSCASAWDRSPDARDGNPN